MGFYSINFLVAVLSIFCLAFADLNDSQYESQRNLILDIYHNPSVNNAAKERHIPQLIAFYRRYPNEVPLSNLDKQEFEKFIHDYEEPRSTTIDGVGPQGGSVGYVFGNFIARIGARYFTSIFNKKEKESEGKRGANSTTTPPRI
ncbi:protein Turandot X [Drosophila eugracilis]|uniref:protein Turandot X n=1 Tax=Drosophila eugracilis TaxID=29029 RepID=UPI001BDA24DA|nr:protein Turandot X [Drosophila eugracilis]XP_017074742.2 protein Turandot X [Drosophila eugracilis]